MQSFLFQEVDEKQKKESQSKVEVKPVDHEDWQDNNMEMLQQLLTPARKIDPPSNRTFQLSTPEKTMYKLVADTQQTPSRTVEDQICSQPEVTEQSEMATLASLKQGQQMLKSDKLGLSRATKRVCKCH